MSPRSNLELQRQQYETRIAELTLGLNLVGAELQAERRRCRELSFKLAESTSSKKRGTTSTQFPSQQDCENRSTPPPNSLGPPPRITVTSEEHHENVSDCPPRSTASVTTTDTSCMDSVQPVTESRCGRTKSLAMAVASYSRSRSDTEPLGEVFEMHAKLVEELRIRQNEREKTAGLRLDLTANDGTGNPPGKRTLLDVPRNRQRKLRLLARPATDDIRERASGESENEEQENFSSSETNWKLCTHSSSQTDEIYSISCSSAVDSRTCRSRSISNSSEIDSRSCKRRPPAERDSKNCRRRYSRTKSFEVNSVNNMPRSRSNVSEINSRLRLKSVSRPKRPRRGEDSRVIKYEMSTLIAVCESMEESVHLISGDVEGVNSLLLHSYVLLLFLAITNIYSLFLLHPH